jgi:hypothetical protein
MIRINNLVRLGFVNQQFWPVPGHHRQCTLAEGGAKPKQPLLIMVDHRDKFWIREDGDD